MQLLQRCIAVVLDIVLIILLPYLLLIISGVRPYVVESGSMEPAVHVGSLCFIDEKANWEKINVGDVIAYQMDNGASVMHRLIQKEGLRGTTKGDANDTPDGYEVNVWNFRGKFLFSIPFLGRVLWDTRTSLIIALLTATIIIISALIEFDKKLSKNRMK